MKRLLNILRRLVYEQQCYRFYRYDPALGLGREDPRITVHASWQDIPESFRPIAVPSSWKNPMYYRLRRGKAVLLCLSEDGQQLDAYLWVQDWSLFRRKYGRISRTGKMIGFGWTAPDKRGRGILARLLRHGFTLCPSDQPILSCIRVENMASRRGAEKAGFQALGDWHCQTWLRIWGRLRPASPQAPG